MIKTKNLNDFKVKKIILPPLPDNKKVKGGKLLPLYSNIFICARKCSGKTTVIANILKECVDSDTKINIFCSTVYKDRSYVEILKFLQKKGCDVVVNVSSVGDDRRCLIREILDEPVENSDEETDEESEEETYIKIKPDKTEKPKKLTKRKKIKIAQKRIIILDDIGDELRKPIINQLLKVNRHIKAKVILSSQYLNDLSPQALRQIDNWLIFSGMKHEKLNKILRDSDAPYTYEEFERIYKYCCMKKYQFMYLDCNNNKVRRCFNEEVFLSEN